MNNAEVIRMMGAFDATELAAIAAALVERDAADVCQVAMVIVMHPGEGGHEVLIATTIENDPAAVAALLRHSAAHTHGGCESCRRRNRERGNRARK